MDENLTVINSSRCIRTGKNFHQEEGRQQHIRLRIYSDAIYVLIFVPATFSG